MAGFSFAPTYQDYLTNYNAQHGQASEGGGGGYFSQDQWNALGSRGQWGQLGGGMSIGSDDPRWAALAQQLGITAKSGPDATINLYGGPKPSNLGGLVDQSRVLSGDDSYATAHSNLTPQAEFAGGGLSVRGWVISGLGLLAGGAALGGAFSGAGAGLEGGGSVVGNAGDAGYAGAFDSSGFAGTGLDTSVGGAAATGAPEGAGGFAGLDSGVGNPYGPGAFDSSGFSGTALDPAAGSGSSLLQQLNSGRRYFNSARSLMNLLSGGGSQTGGRNMPGATGNGMSDLLGSLGSLLGLGALGRQSGLFGGGVGTPSGATDIANRASQAADPFGAGGSRTMATNLLQGGSGATMANLLGLNPDGTRSDITKDPGYQFALSEGTNAINIGDAAQGSLRSGNRGVELEKYGSGLAAQYEGQFRGENLASGNLLANMAGMGSSSPAASGASLISGFEGATSLQNSGGNGLLAALLGGGSSSGGLGSIASLLGRGASGVSSFLSSLFGSGDTTDSTVNSFLSDGGWGDFTDLSGGMPF